MKQSNSELKTFNEFSQQSFSAVSNDFVKHTKVLKGLKADLDYIFKHTRQLKEKIQAKYPEAFVGLPARPDLDEEED
eukprot:gene24897-30358_t